MFRRRACCFGLDFPRPQYDRNRQQDDGRLDNEDDDRDEDYRQCKYDCQNENHQQSRAGTVVHRREGNFLKPVGA